VGEFEIEQSHDQEVQIVNAGLSLKTILKEGILQNKDSIGFAVEVETLLPSTASEERKFGFEGIAIVSGQLFPVTYHVNFGGGVDRAETNPFAVWGIIVELPVLANFRLVGEFSGEHSGQRLPDESVLLGFIWELSSAPILLDGGIRRGIGQGAPEWQFTTGLTWTFSLPSWSGASVFGGTS